MTDPDSHAPIPDDAPIDAEFEEAPPPARRRMPAWLPLAAIAVVALVVLVALTGPWALRELESASAPAEEADEQIAEAAAVPTPQDAADARAPAASSAELEAAQAEIDVLRAEIEQLRAATEAQQERQDAQAPAPLPVTTPAPAELVEPAAPDAALAARLAVLELAAPNIARTEDRLDQIEDRLAEIADAIDQLPDRRAFAALEERVEAMELRAARNPAEAAWRFATLREAAARGAPFEAERAALARLRPDDSDLAAMADAAVTGVPTLDELRDSFPAAEIRAATVVVPEEAGRFAWLRNWFGGLVRVRRVDGAASAGEQAVASAESALAEGDLVAAIGAVRDLDGAPADAASYWLGRAELRARLDARIGAVQDSLAREAGQ